MVSLGSAVQPCPEVVQSCLLSVATAVLAGFFSAACEIMLSIVTLSCCAMLAHDGLLAWSPPAASFDQQETEQARLFLSQRLAKATPSLNESTNRNVLLKVWDRLAVNRAEQVARRLEVACVCIQQQTALCEKTITIWRRCMLRMRRNAKTGQRFSRHALAARTLRRWVAYRRRARIRARAVAVPVAARSGMVLRWWWLRCLREVAEDWRTCAFTS